MESIVLTIDWTLISILLTIGVGLLFSLVKRTASNSIKLVEVSSAITALKDSVDKDVKSVKELFAETKSKVMQHDESIIFLHQHLVKHE